MALDSETIIKQAIHDSKKKQKRGRASSFYFGPPGEQQNWDDAFDNFDFEVDKSAKTPLIPQKQTARSSKIFSFEEVKSNK